MASDEPQMDPMTEALLALSEGMAPIYEAGQGVKARVLADGASAETADAIYREFMIGMFRKALGLA